MFCLQIIFFINWFQLCVLQINAQYFFYKCKYFKIQFSLHSFFKKRKLAEKTQPNQTCSGHNIPVEKHWPGAKLTLKENLFSTPASNNFTAALKMTHSLLFLLVYGLFSFLLCASKTLRSPSGDNEAETPVSFENVTVWKQTSVAAACCPVWRPAVSLCFFVVLRFANPAPPRNLPDSNG